MQTSKNIAIYLLSYFTLYHFHFYSEPTKLRVNLNIYAEIKAVATEDGDAVDMEDPVEPTKEEQQLDELSQRRRTGELFSLNIHLDLAEFAFSFGDLGKTFRICSDELFSLTEILPVPDGTSMKFCIRITELQTYMPANGALWITFKPFFSVSIRKASSQGSLGFSGGIEFKADDFVAFLNLTVYCVSCHFLVIWGLLILNVH